MTGASNVECDTSSNCIRRRSARNVQHSLESLCGAANGLHAVALERSVQLKDVISGLVGFNVLPLATLRSGISSRGKVAVYFCTGPACFAFEFYRIDGAALISSMASHGRLCVIFLCVKRLGSFTMQQRS